MSKFDDFWIDLSKFSGGRVREAISTEVQKRAFGMGYVWVAGPSVQLTNSPYLHFSSDGYLTWSGISPLEAHMSTLASFGYAHVVVMSAEDFLHGKSKQNKVFADFTWVKGTARDILMHSAVNNFCFAGYQKIWDSSEGYLIVDKDENTITTRNAIPKGIPEITCNKLLEGKI
jgi:hypothetical protein